MKNKLTSIVITALAAWLPICAFGIPGVPSTAFTYQGQLLDAGLPANGSNDVRFALHDTAFAGLAISTNITFEDLKITNGLFTVTLDWGGTPFDGFDRWLEISVRPGSSSGDFVPLSPRQKLSPAPSALFALSAGTAASATNLTGTLGSGQLSGTYGNTVRLTNTANVFTGNGTGLANVNAATLNGLTSGNFWRLDGNDVTAGQFLGSTNKHPLELRVNNSRVLRLEPNANGAPNIVAGAQNNYVRSGVVGAVIGGGGATNFTNFIESDFGAIAGGRDNSISSNSPFGSIAGGAANQIAGSSLACAIAGGAGNEIRANSERSAIGGGRVNYIGSNSAHSTIVGGDANTITNNAPFATIVGGTQNAATNNALAAGTRAKANHSGAFVWGDCTSTDITSTTNNSVTMRAIGGYRFFTDSTATLGAFLAPGASFWSSISDRNAKKNFQPVDGKAVLEKLAQVPVQKWNYKFEADDSVPHIGPMAQDFKAAFFPGRDDKSIGTLEFDGVELAAIQGLNQKLNDELKRRDAENAELKRELVELTKLVKAMNQQLNGAAK